MRRRVMVSSGPVIEVKERTELMALKKAELVQMCRENGLKVSGNKAELVERLVTIDVPSPPPPPPPPMPTTETVATEVSDDEQIENLIDDISVDPSAVDPALLISKSSYLLKENGALFERICTRRLAEQANNNVVAAVSLLRGYVAAELKLQARDGVRYVLKTAVGEANDGNIDKCFKLMSDAGKLNPALLSYVEDLLNQQEHAAQRDSGSMLTKVLTIIKDRIEAENMAAQSDELRTLAEAIRIQDPRQRRDYLETKLNTSLDFAQRFEAYMTNAANFLDQGNPISAHVDAEAIKDINVLVSELRKTMPV